MSFLPQTLSVDAAGWLSQIVLAVFFIAGGAGAYFGYKNGRREGLSKRTQQTIEELEGLTQTLAATTDALERQVAQQKDIIASKDKQIESLQATNLEMVRMHKQELDNMKRDFEIERRYLVGVIHDFEKKVGRLNNGV